MGGICQPPKVAPRIPAGADGSLYKYSSMEEKYPAGKMSIYFGSQTGTAMGFAKTLSIYCRKIGFEVRVIDLGDFQPEQLLVSRLAIFIVATYGEGDPTDNALRFYEWLCNTDGSFPSTYLSNVSYAVFGLGNSTYVNYNQMGKRCDAKLELIGGKRVYPFACGDDSSTLEEDFEAWKAKFIEFLAKTYLPSDEPKEIKCTHPKAHLTFTTTPSPPIEADISSIEINTSTKYFFSPPLVILSSQRDLRSPSDQQGRTLHLEFNIPKTTELTYSPADNLAVIPENNKESVELFSSCCGGYNLSQHVRLIPTFEDNDVLLTSYAPFKHPFPNPCSIETIFTKYLDICGIPRRSTLERFGPYLQSKEQLQWLNHLTAKDNREVFVNSIEKEGRTYASLLAKEMSSCVIPLEDLLHLIPFIQPRFYTISSSNSLYPESIHLTVTLSQRKSPSGVNIFGLCTHYLSSLSVGDACRVYLRDSLFKLPSSLHTPVILIGPGSGIAPMRALLQERESQAKRENIPFEEMTNILYFGCKSKELDFLYQEELSSAIDRHALTSLKVAFSREKNEKVYVQHIMRYPENAKEIFNLFDSGGHIFVCGGTEMGAAVAESLSSILSTHKNISIEEGRSLVKEAQKGKIYKQELWSV